VLAGSYGARRGEDVVFIPITGSETTLHLPWRRHEPSAARDNLIAVARRVAARLPPTGELPAAHDLGADVRLRLIDHAAARVHHSAFHPARLAPRLQGEGPIVKAPPSPSGFSPLWFGPATYPSAETAM
jgi:hypothetical protein